MSGDSSPDERPCDGRPERSGLLLAGGRSTRFGEPDKALAELTGAPLVSHTAAALAPAVDELVVNCRAAQRDELASALEGLDDRLPVRFAVDPVPDEGPVAGLLTGLRVTRGRHVAVAGCDQPFLRTATVADLFDHATGETGSGAETAAAPTGAAPVADGRRQPLGAVYRQDRAQEAAIRTMAAGSQALRDVLARVDPVAVPVSPAVVRDIDTQHELDEVSGGQASSSADSSSMMGITHENAASTTNRPASHTERLPGRGEP
ncbi:molybdenum cofactor guanylyltransferase [Haloglomus salinum]|jgi:molybdopterin-guanine dinucleotide biosynthesis protein A|uniref:molybdenum cofactor guanylyltransferase n=1 Tax=Haloglomus salinum TaxID=2962673 RepID=UPI0020C9FE8C|nr:molybdenum cofactor guanylyltransferase [Haloglomus salinum]